MHERRMHKFVSNSKEVMETIPADDRATGITGIKKLDLKNNNLPIERALGVEWCIESDSFQLCVTLQNKSNPWSSVYRELHLRPNGIHDSSSTGKTDFTGAVP
jgi:hypothetical protein